MLRRREIALPGGARVVLLDSISTVGTPDAGAVVVSGSHGGESAADYAAAVPLRACFFNDAGVGKDAAGIVALALLEARGVPAGAYGHDSARIGDAEDAWANGALAHLNSSAARLGLRVGDPLAEAIRRVFG